MANQVDASSRAAKLAKLFIAVVQGQRQLKTAADGDRFLEALCAEQDASKCVQLLVTGKAGLSAVAQAFRFSQDSAFLNGKAALVLHYLSNQSLKQLYGGQFLYRVLAQIVQPPTFWNTLVHAHENGALTHDGTHAFAWLLLELLYSRLEELPDVRSVAEKLTRDESLIQSDSLEARNLGHKIKHLLTCTSTDLDDGPGGRHDNDFTDFRKIKILPTSDEFDSSDSPFYRRGDAIETTPREERGFLHLDNQFRLLREDLLGELRNDYQIAIGQKKGKNKTVLTNLALIGVDCGTELRRKPCSFMFRCMDDIPRIKTLRDPKDRKKYLTENKGLLKHQSLGCIVSDGRIIAFASVDRNEDNLCQVPAVINLRIADDSFVNKVLLTWKITPSLQFVQVDTAVFAYEPILKCLQSMTEVPLQEQLLDLEPGSGEEFASTKPTKIVNAIRSNIGNDLQSIVGTKKPVELDTAQTESLLNALSRKVSVIQGPPGTGKSFLGALAAKVLHDHTKEKILVLTYNNHAQDQFLVDIEGIGVPPQSIVRLGHKYDDKTKHLSMSNQPNSYKMSGKTYQTIQEQKSLAEGFYDTLAARVHRYCVFQVTNQALLDYLEFSEDSQFFDAFELPQNEGGMIRVGKRGKGVDRWYLMRRWRNGLDAGVFQKKAAESHSKVWASTQQERNSLMRRWCKDIFFDEASEIQAMVRKFNQCCESVEQLFREKGSFIINNKRIIGCTTTGAAKYTEDIQKAAPGIILVEEAGEILESHILIGLTAQTKQVILIGDHKQLRPKISNYDLTVEKGRGFNLNMSLFERLVMAGFPHTTLNKQHRMRPEISSLVRSMTYPELEDAPRTKGRPPLRGFCDNIIFLSHTHPEVNADRIGDRRDEGAKSSKENIYEAEMTLKCVRYLGQQGYGTDKIVVLTPYLGQLYLLLKHLSRENDPVLNDLDSYELIRAGLLSPAGANITKRRLRISTIDNYQGEESEIVIACLTRSNQKGDIGFMSAPQRVNVLLSRARNALIMIGNASTFMASRKGKDVWIPLMNQLTADGHVYDGFPVKCEQHPDKTALLASKDAFDLMCPDGGCSEPCGKLLSCDKHTCPQKCHQLQDHSKMPCGIVIAFKCPQGHKMSRKCHDKASTTCRKCEAEKRALEKKRERDFKLDQERQVKQRAYAAKLAEIEDEMEHQKRLLKDQADEDDRQHSLAQKRQDLANLKAKVSTGSKSLPPSTATLPPTEGVQSQDPFPSAAKDSENKEPKKPTADQVKKQEDGGQPDREDSEARDDWEWQKTFEGAQNSALDSLVSMIGLESVKQKFLALKAKIDTVVRQNIPLKGERFGAALLGNPGTGKTTVARLYAKFLADVGALPGNHFFETSGSALANEGVSACKGHIEKILEEGGGVFFIDETYQLVSGNSPGGKAVLDYLLAEIENLTGKIVFVLAGYHKQMEAFFAHNPGIPSRIPIQMEFQDYNDKELQMIFCHYIDAKYKGSMKVEDGMAGLYVRIVARRIGAGRGRDGFGNARDVQNKISQISERQAKRLRKQRREKLSPDDLFLTKEDLIGPEPSAVLKNNAAWAKLQTLIGLKSVKESVQALLDGIQFNYQRELQEKPLVQYSLNRCFIGSPGTGKTSVAKLYGQILKDIELLSNGEVVVKNPADFVGDVLGGSEANTKAILASTVGKVLIIDEAYMLAGGSATGTSDPYKAAVIDTIVAEVQSTPGEDRCVLLLGYKDQMEEMLRDVNPGLARRFPLDNSFVFEDFSDDELRQILDLKLNSIGFGATDQAKRVAMEMLQRLRNRPNFGNAGEVDNILNTAKSLHQKHMTAGKSTNIDVFDAIDFDPDFDRGERAATNLPALFQDEIGREDVIKLLQGYQTTAANMKRLDMEPREQIPFNFLFKGPPGTGKTTTAQKMGKVFYDMGFLSQAKVIECSATDMIGQYVGQTGPKVQKLLEKGLGKVLFIDEAYRLAEGHFATEAMDELVDCLTKPKFARKLVVILAGYDHDMDRLMSINPGLSSRFPESVFFKPLSPNDCFNLLSKALEKQTQLDISVLSDPSSTLREIILECFRKLSELKSWGNARDVKQLSKNIFGKLISSDTLPVGKFVLSESIVLDTLTEMLTERIRRSEAVGTTRFPGPDIIESLPPPQTQEPPNTLPPKTATQTKKAEPPPPAVEEDQQEVEESEDSSTDDDPEDPIESIFKAKRDPGVSDEVWEQLERDKRAMYDREVAYRVMQEEKRLEEQRIEELRRAEQAAADEEEKRLREAERIQAELERRRKEQVLMEEKRRRESERKVQRRLREMGLCPAGFRWIRQGAGGYRCAGGSHFLSDAQVGV